MRHSWRLLLLRAHLRSHYCVASRSSCFQVKSDPNLRAFRFFSSLLSKHSSEHTASISALDSQFNRISPGNGIRRGFSSEPALEQSESDHVIVSDVFSKSSDFEEIKRSLDLSGVAISHELVLKVLGTFESSPDVAVRFFNWVLENEGARLSSKSYNSMLSILGGNGLFKEFWDLTDAMKKKGFGISKAVRDKMLETLEKADMENDANRLRDVFALGSMRNTPEEVCLRLCKRTKVWGDDVERQIKDLNITWSSDRVKDILENLETEPMKALIFFRWIDENGMFKHNELTYNAMARVLGREDCFERFWKFVGEMRSSGYEMEVETYLKVLGRFCKRKMIEDSVMLYEFAMAGVNKPSAHCCTFLMRKIVVHKDLNISLFSRVVQTFTSNGNVLSNSMISAVLRSLNNAGRFGELNQVLEVLEKVGFVVSGELQSEVAFRYTKAGKKDEAYKFMDSIEASGRDPYYKTWSSLIEGHCRAGNLDEAADCFQRMVVKGGALSAGYAFDLLITAYCKKKRATDASIFLCDLVNEKNLVPWHATYKVIISGLLEQGGFKESLKLLPLMKNHGFPPYIDPIIEYVSKHGTGEDAIVLLKVMTSQKFPATSVFLRMFKAFFTAKRLSDAQDFLSKCPAYIRNHADVLNLFSSEQPGEVGALMNAAAS